jgi:hypothetical protein
MVLNYNVKLFLYYLNAGEENIKGPFGPQMMLTFVAHSGYYFYGGDNYGKNSNRASKD